MGREYLKQCLKILDRNLKRLSRQEKLGYLNSYKFGLEAQLYCNYPNKFTVTSEVKIGSESPEHERGAYSEGCKVADQFGPLETGIARELLEEVKKRQTKFSRTSWLQEYYELFGRVLWK